MAFSGLTFGRDMARQTRSSFSRPRLTRGQRRSKRPRKKKPVDLSPKHLAYQAINHARGKAMHMLHQRK